MNTKDYNSASGSSKNLRAQLRQSRRSLNPLQQQLASKRICQRIINHAFYKRAHNIAFYAAIDGELNLDLLIQSSVKKGKRCYLPSVEKPSHHLVFKRLETHAAKALTTKTLKKGAFGIFHVANKKSLPNRQLDLVLMPLLGFDKQGNRLGMGGGYYDYTFRKHKQGIRKTRLLGVAHRCQQVEKIQTQAWDIKPEKIIAV